MFVEIKSSGKLNERNSELNYATAYNISFKLQCCCFPLTLSRTFVWLLQRGKSFGTAEIYCIFARFSAKNKGERRRSTAK